MSDEEDICEECDGEGLVECEECMGHGQCFHCGHDCDICGGEGSLECPLC